MASQRMGNGQTLSQRQTANAPQRQSNGGQRQSRLPRYSDVSQYNPANLGTKSSDSVGALEAEFLIALFLLILLMFSSSSSSFSNKIMSVMKRGTLVCILFFVLALVSSAGPNAAKIAKAFGALVIVAILITSDMGAVFGDLDNIIKNDWIGTSETEGGTSASSADSGTGSTANPSGGSSALNGLQQILNDLNPAAKAGQIVGTSLGGLIKNYIKEFPSAIKNLPSNLLKEFGL